MSIELFHQILIGFSAVGLLVFIALFFVKAGYGMFRTAQWGFSIPNKIGWLLFELHYFQRSFVFPFLMKGKSRMPVAIMLMGVVFNLLNGYIQGEWLFFLAPEDLYSSAYLCRINCWIGILVFFLGMGINWHSDYVIRHLRQPGDTRHYLPEKGLYHWVTSGNYFGELLEWTGFALATASPAAWVFVWWTFANLAPRAYAIRQKYREEFGVEAVGKRKCLIPYIF